MMQSYIAIMKILYTHKTKCKGVALSQGPLVRLFWGMRNAWTELDIL